MTRTSALGTALAVALAAIPLAAAAPAAGTPLDQVVKDDLEFARERLMATASSVPADRYPMRTGPEGDWVTTGPGYWTSGFFPASLWLAHAATGDPRLASEAEARLPVLEAQKRDGSGSDQGFKMLGSFGRGYLLTGRDRYRRAAVRAAASLASRFSPAVGATRSWGNRRSEDFTVIVDNLMNLELLFWAARHGGNPAWHGMALSHALRTAREHVRRDGSTFHVVDFNPRTGKVRRKRTRQGYARRSTWSRGQAWAAYGFTMAYRETRDERLLEAARRTADWFLAHLPYDRVPYWDFDAPGIPDAPRDSSAAAVAASGLLEQATLDPDARRAARYRDAAESIVASLSSDSYLARGDSTQALLLHGTQDRPRGKYDTGLSFGDYYLLESLLRHRTPPRPPSAPAIEIRVSHARERPRVRVGSDEPGRIRAALLARRATARGLGLHGGRSGILARGRGRLEAPGTTRVRMRAVKGAPGRPRGLRSALLTLSVVLATPDGRSAARSVPVPLG